MHRNPSPPGGGEGRRAMRQGHDLEDYVAQRFTEATGLRKRTIQIPMARKEAHAICVMCLIKWKIVERLKVQIV